MLCMQNISNLLKEIFIHSQQVLFSVAPMKRQLYISGNFLMISNVHKTFKSDINFVEKFLSKKYFLWQ